MGSGGGIIGSVVGSVAGGLIGGKKSRDAGDRAASYAGAAAQAQEAEARAQFSQIQQTAQQGLNAAINAGQMTPQELRALEGQLGAAEKQIAADERLLQAVDPALMEASQQALKLLRGDKAQSLGPLEAQRQRDRQALVQSLKEQYGPGAESTSAGAKILRQFDSETANIMNTAQQQSLGTLLGTAQASRPSLGQGAQIYGNASAGASNVANRGLQAALGGYGQFLNAYTTGGANVLQAAGSQFTAGTLSNQQRAQSYQNMGDQFFNLAGQGIGALAGAASSAGPAAASDARVKTNIKPLNKEDVAELKRTIKPYAFRYINEALGKGEHIGVMAQDLEKSKLGRELVFENEQGVKLVDMNKLLFMLLAMEAEG